MLDQSYAHGNGCEESLTCDEELAGQSWSDPGDDEWRNDGRNDAEFDFRESELDRLDGNPNVAGCNQTRAAPEGSSVNTGDNRFLRLRNSQIHLPDGSGIGNILVMRVLNHAFHPVQIRTGAE